MIATELNAVLGLLVGGGVGNQVNFVGGDVAQFGAPQPDVFALWIVADCLRVTVEVPIVARVGPVFGDEVPVAPVGGRVVIDQ